MPRIPLLRQPGPIANAPAPVLDNQRRPNVDNRAVSQAVGNLAQASQIRDVDPRDFTAPYAALGAVGRAVSQAGDVLGGLAIKKREAQTDIQIAEADQVMQDAFNQHAAWRTKTPDTTAWEGNLTETLSRARQSIEGNDKLHPAAREKIRLRLSKFEGDAKADLLRDSAKMEFRRAGSVYDASAERAMRNKDYGEAERIAMEKEEKGYGYPHETEHLRTIIGKSKEQDAKDAEAERVSLVYNLVLSDPDKVEENFDSMTEGLDPRDRDSLRTQIEQAKTQRAASEVDTLSDRMASGEFQTLAALQAAFPERMRPTMRKQFEGALLRGQQPAIRAQLEKDAPQNFARFSDAVESYKPEDDKEGTRYAQIVMAAKQAMPEELRGEILGPLYKKRTGTGTLDAPEPLKQTARDIVSTMFDSGALGNFKAMNAEGKEVEDPKKKAAAYAKKGEVMIYMGKWMQQNPDATPDKAFEVIRQMIAGNAPLIRSTVAPAAAPPDYSAKPTRNQPVAPWENDLPAGAPGEIDPLIPFYLPIDQQLSD